MEGTLNSYYAKTSDYEFEATLQPLYLTSGYSDGSKPQIVSTSVKSTGGYGFRIPMENIPAGWYYLSITAYPLAQNLPTLRSSIGKVGIGEVFIISGQSNAQGLPNQPGDLNIAYPLPTYDAVRVQPNAVDPNLFIDFSKTRSVDAVRKEYLTPTVAAKDVATNQGIAPAGGSLWYWARVGERLAAQFNVPIAFYNAAFGGTQIKTWYGSKDGQGEPLGQPGANPPNYNPGSPYLLLRKSLNLYGSSFGARAVLWLQGETDVRALTDNWGTARTVADSTDYSNLLQAVIQQSRQDFGKSVPWVIGKASYFTETNHYRGPSPDNSKIVRGGQRLAVSTATQNGLSQVFEGPDTDVSVSIRRSGDVIHFGRRDANNPNGPDGLADAANAWFDNLNGLMNRLIPVTVDGTGTLPQILSISDDGTTASAPPGYTTQWVQDNGTGFDMANTVATGTMFSGNGSFRAVLTNGQGNRIVTQSVQLPFRVVNNVQPPPDACSSFTEGAEVAYRAFGDPNVKVVVRQRGACKYAVWSDGSEDMPVDWLPYVNTIGSFTKEAMRQCLKFNSEPCGTTSPLCAFSPTITSNVTTPACGQGVQLTAGCNGADCGGVSYAWSGNGISGSGSTVSVNVPNANGNFTYTLTASKAGCSNQSANITFTISGCGGGGGDPCSAFTPGTQVAYRAIGDPNIKVVVVQRGACKYAVWSDFSEDMPVDWLPYVNTIGTFTKDAMRQCLKFNGEPCGARLGAVEPGSAVADLGLHIAPNPSNGRFTVHFQTRLGEVASLRLSDLSGRSVRAVQAITGTGGEHTEAIALPGSVGGVVIVEVVSGGRRASQKVLIE